MHIVLVASFIKDVEVILATNAFQVFPFYKGKNLNLVNLLGLFVDALKWVSSPHLQKSTPKRSPIQKKDNLWWLICTLQVGWVTMKMKKHSRQYDFKSLEEFTSMIDKEINNAIMDLPYGLRQPMKRYKMLL